MKGTDMNEKLPMKEHEPQGEIIELAPNGLGFGRGLISVEKRRRETASPEAFEEALQASEHIIKSGDAFDDVTSHDDGCGDGRLTRMVYRFQDGVMNAYEKLSRRAKVFGGGLVVATSMLRAIVPERIKKDDSILKDRKKMIDILRSADVPFGAHTDDHHTDHTDCGCGAIDKYPLTTENVLEYRSAIKDTTVAVYENVYGYSDEVLERKNKALEAVLKSYEDQAENAATYASDAGGTKTMDLIKENGAEVKQLQGSHLEAFIVLNDIEATTFDQQKFAELLKERGVSDEIQAFAVDLWRGRMYAELVAQYVSSQYKDTDNAIDLELAYDMAEADFHVRMLGIAATLTSGDLKVFARRKKDHTPAA